MAQRNRLLARRRCRDAAWLAALEDAMATSGVAVAAARREHGGAASAARASRRSAPFPRGRSGAALARSADWLDEQPALAVEDGLRRRLAEARRFDAAAGLGRAAAPSGPPERPVGPPRGQGHAGGALLDRRAEGAADRRDPGHAALIAAARGFAPMLLLDEVAAHLDPERRAALFVSAGRLPAQALADRHGCRRLRRLRGMPRPMPCRVGGLLRMAIFRAGSRPRPICLP